MNMGFMRIRIHDAERLKIAVLANLLLIFSLIIAQPAGAVPGALRGTELDRLVPELMTRADIAGLCLVVLQDGRISYIGNYGVKDSRTGEPVGADTTFFAASLSKPMFAYAVLRLAQRGEIDLDQPLFKYLPSPRLEGDQRYRRITARMVLSHSSGLPNWSKTDSMALSFEPGSSWQYSGEGFVYLQKVVEKITGQDLNEFMQQEVFKPLKMNSSSFIATSELSNRMATGHDLLGNATKKPSPTRQSMNPAGTLITTGADYGHFIEGYLAQRGLSPKLAGSMSTAQVRPTGFFGGVNDQPVYWGLGFGIEARKSGNTVWQWGDNLDYRNFVMVDPVKGDGIIMLTNSENGLSIAEELSGMVIGGAHPVFDWLPFAEYDDPRSIALHAMKQDYMENAGRQAEALYKRARMQLPAAQLTELVMSLGQHLTRDGHSADTLGLLKMHLRHNAGDHRAHDMLASFYLSTGESALALLELRESAKLDPDNTERNRTIARISRQL
jgi:CubicO group peptidase (beta-lactamase class C family)